MADDDVPPSAEAGADSAEAPAGSAEHLPREIGTEALHALAHPLRVRMYDELSSRGPATASELARRFGESTGATSYHLRQLAKHGFIEEDPTRGTLRERYWRATPGNQRFASQQTLRTAAPATREAVRLVTSEWNRGRIERVEHWRATMHTWPMDWAEASLDLTGHTRLTATELAEFNAELRELVTRWADRVRDLEGDDRYDVELQIHAFPLEPPRAYHGGLTSEPLAPGYGPPAGPPDPFPPPRSPFPPPPPMPNQPPPPAPDQPPDPSPWPQHPHEPPKQLT
jgi:DNA-binding transcriptional ArsR family regulator